MPRSFDEIRDDIVRDAYPFRADVFRETMAVLAEEGRSFHTRCMPDPQDDPWDMEPPADQPEKK